MARSRKYTPVGGNTKSESEKWWKSVQNRRLRRKVKILLSKTIDDVDINLRDISSVWAAPKDGKTFWLNPDESWMRK